MFNLASAKISANIAYTVESNVMLRISCLSLGIDIILISIILEGGETNTNEESNRASVRVQRE